MHVVIVWKSVLYQGIEHRAELKLSHSYSIHNFVFKNKKEQNRNDEEYSQTGVTVQIHTNHDSVRVTAIMLKSILPALQQNGTQSWLLYLLTKTQDKNSTLPASRISFCKALISFSRCCTLLLTSKSSLVNRECFTLTSPLSLSSALSTTGAACSWISFCLKVFSVKEMWTYKHMDS